MNTNTSPNMETPNLNPEPFFRPSKKRKLYRQRVSENEQQPAAQSLDELIDSASAEPSMAAILRMRKSRKARMGVEFRASETKDEEIVEEVKEEVSSGSATRFAPQTGMVGDVDRHMMAYIDSRLASQRAAERTAPVFVRATTTERTTATEGGKEAGKKEDAATQKQPAALGKLMEIDLGEEARSRNVQRTDMARRKMEGEDVAEEVTAKPVKVRLGPDGKPWRSRRNRRGSDDVKRDRMVEDVLKESRLEIYEEPAPEPEHLDDQAADDRIAEQFRQEFYDSQRARKGKAQPPPPSRVKGEEDLKGPKLGGSRNARAAMKEAMLKDAKKTKK